MSCNRARNVDGENSASNAAKTKVHEPDLEWEKPETLASAGSLNSRLKPGKQKPHGNLTTVIWKEKRRSSSSTLNGILNLSESLAFVKWWLPFQPECQSEAFESQCRSRIDLLSVNDASSQNHYDESRLFSPKLCCFSIHSRWFNEPPLSTLATENRKVL